MGRGPALNTRELSKILRKEGIGTRRRRVGGRRKSGRDSIEFFREDNNKVYTVQPEKRGGSKYSWPVIKKICDNLKLDADLVFGIRKSDIATEENRVTDKTE